MISFLVQSLPLKEVVQNLAQEMNTDFIERCDQYMLNIPPALGKGSIMGIDFDNGMGIIQYDCQFNQDIEIKFIVNKVHPLKFIYCIDGMLTHKFENDLKEHLISKFQNVIVSSSKQNGHILNFEKDIPIKLNSLEIARKKFQTKTRCELNSLEHPIQNLFNDVNAGSTFYHEGFYSVELADIFEDIHRFDKQDFLKKIFLEGKSYLILTRQLVQLQDDLLDSSIRTVLKKSEIKQIRSVAAKIETSLTSITSIRDLGLEFGLNSNKLQKGFQLLFNQSVNQYIQNQRLIKARHLLENSDKTMSEITDDIGLNSRSYFSKVFKEEFGISPSDLRRKNNKTLQ